MLDLNSKKFENFDYKPYFKCKIANLIYWIINTIILIS